MENNIGFRKFNFRQDIEELFEIMLGSEQFLFHGTMQVNTLPDFEKWMIGNMAHHFHDFYVLYDKKSFRIIGYVYSYEYRRFDLTCKLCAYLKSEYRDIGLGAYSTIKFADELFSNYPLRKVYVDVYDYNEQSLKSNLDAGFVEEGCLKEYRYHKGKYYDMHLLSMSRETFYDKFGKLVQEDGKLS